MSSAFGFVTTAVRCQGCDGWIGIAATTGKSPEMLSDPFEAKCPLCGNQSTYRKDAIQILRAGQADENL